MGTVSISGKTYNIYGEHTDDTQGVDSSVTYFIGQLNTSAWDDAGFTDQQKALVTATRILDKQRWTGSPTDPNTPQPLAWPRTGVTDCDGNAVATDAVPDEIVFATYELAAAIIADAAVQSEASGGSNVKRTKARDKVGDLETERETEYFTSTSVSGSRTSLGRFPTAVQEYVKCFLGGTGLSLAYVTGSRASNFADAEYGFVDPGLEG